MNYNNLSYSPLFEKSLIRLISEFNSEMSISVILSNLTKELKTRVSRDSVNGWNINLSRSKDGIFRLETAFMNYRDSRLVLINLLKWIERNGNTDKRNNLTIDMKFIDTTKGPFKGTLFNSGVTIDKINKLKMILDFDENFVYDTFPSRRHDFTSKSITKFNITQKFIPKEESLIDPKFYVIPNTSECGINFETLNEGFLRLQYIGGKDYEKKSSEILQIMNQFCVIAWDSVINPTFKKENIKKFEQLVDKNKKIRESFIDYALFCKNYPNIKFSVDLLFHKTTLSTYYDSIKDIVYDFLSNAEINGEIEMNYDTTLRNLQIKDGKLRVDKLNKIEFINCELEFGTYTTCDFYQCKLIDSLLNVCNLFLNTESNRCKIVNSVVNRTAIVSNSEFYGENGVMNGKMMGGVFKDAGIGVHAEIDPSVLVIDYKALKPGYFVAGDKVIIPTKKYRTL